MRLILEDAQVPYEDLGRKSESEGGGMEAVLDHMYGDGEGAPGYAPPFLIDGKLKLAQMPAICAYLGQKHNLAPKEEGPCMRALQLQLTITDVLDEVHETHHPIAKALYYEDQKEEAKQAARAFREKRLPQWITFFEKTLRHSGGDYLVGQNLSYVDLGLFQLIEGLRYAFPAATEKALNSAALVTALHQTVQKRPSIVSYLASEQRIPFNEDGIFRYYPELNE